MKVAYLPGAFPMLSETPVLNQITGLVERGVDLEIFGDRPRPGTPWHPDIGRLNLLARTHYRPDLPSHTLARWRSAVRYLGQTRGPDRVTLLRAMNLFRFGTRAATGRLPLQTVQFLPAQRWDIIVGGFGEQGLKALRMQRVGAMQGPLVTAFRGADLTRFLRQRGPRVYRALFRSGELFLPVSHEFARRLERMGCPPERIRVHRTGIDLRRHRFEPRRPGQVPELISIGRLVPKKGLSDALRALARLAREGASWRYTIVGDGPLRSELERLVEELALGDRVRFLGHQLPDQVATALRAADILLAPSVTAPDGDEEGIPNVLKEAMAIGRPVVSTRHSGIPELVEDGVTGLLVTEHDVPGLAAMIGGLLARSAEWGPMLERARRKVESEYDIEKLNDTFVTLLEACARESRHGHVH